MFSVRAEPAFEPWKLSLEPALFSCQTPAVMERAHGWIWSWLHADTREGSFPKSLLLWILFLFSWSLRTAMAQGRCFRVKGEKNERAQQANKLHAGNQHLFMREPPRLLLWLELGFASPVWGHLNKGKPQGVNHTMLRRSEAPWSPQYLKNYHLAPWWICLTLATSGSESDFWGFHFWEILLPDLCSAASSPSPSAGTSATI